jgi:hypothetical protein
LRFTFLRLSELRISASTLTVFVPLPRRGVVKAPSTAPPPLPSTTSSPSTSSSYSTWPSTPEIEKWTTSPARALVSTSSKPG